jgi:hypothetical protein
MVDKKNSPFFFELGLTTSNFIKWPDFKSTKLYSYPKRQAGCIFFHKYTQAGEVLKALILDGCRPFYNLELGLVFLNPQFLMVRR